MSKVKICGLTRPKDIEAVNSCMPDYIGFVFADKSRRKVTAATAKKLKKNLNPQIHAVGVFVNNPIDEIVCLCKKNIIDIVQLHGDEDENYITDLSKSISCPIIKAVAVAHNIPVYPANADYLLFDTASTERGGTGKTFDWSLLSKHSGVSYFLAGGLNLENAADAVTSLQPYCVDVSSGVEANGLKDSEKIKKFVDIVRKHSR